MILSKYQTFQMQLSWVGCFNIWWCEYNLKSVNLCWISLYFVLPLCCDVTQCVLLELRLLVFWLFHWTEEEGFAKFKRLFNRFNYTLSKVFVWMRMFWIYRQKAVWYCEPWFLIVFISFCNCLQMNSNNSA